MQTDTRYNGWTNYATWRVNLEVFDGMSPRDIAGDGHDEADELAPTLREYAESFILDSSEPGLARDYALAFLSEVNWREIAQHMIDAYADESADADA